jgi:uncharacterized protein
MPRLITEQSFYQYLKCPSWVYFDAHALEGKPHHALLSMLADGGLVPEIERAVLKDRELAEVTAEDPESAFMQTLAFMREGRQTIYHGVLIDAHSVGHPDLLEKVEGRSKLGDYYYVAADVKHSRHARDEFKFQGCFYAELLERVQGVKPKQGYLVTPDGEILPYLIDEFEAKYALALDDIERIVAGQNPPHFVTSGCKQSPWFDRCQSLSESCRDLSLLNRVWREETSRLERAGIRDVETLAAKSVSELMRLAPDLSPERIEIMRDQAIAMRDGHHMIRRPIDLPQNGVELYFDIESDPLRDFTYLFGVLAVEKGKAEYHAFFADTPEEEGKIWKEFTGFLERYFDAPIFHYGTYERDVASRFAAKFGVSELVREALERNLVDVLERIRPSVIFPLSFYSLKDLAAYAGFAWRSGDASGANSVLWFENYLKAKDAGLKKKIVEYNEDDVRATAQLVDWLRKHAR